MNTKSRGRGPFCQTGQTSSLNCRDYSGCDLQNTLPIMSGQKIKRHRRKKSKSVIIKCQECKKTVYPLDKQVQIDGWGIFHQVSQKSVWKVAMHAPFKLQGAYELATHPYAIVL